MDPWFEVSPIDDQRLTSNGVGEGMDQLPVSIQQIVKDAAQTSSDVPSRQKFSWSFARRVTPEERMLLEETRLFVMSPDQDPFGMQYVLEIQYLRSWYRLTLYVAK